MCHSVHMEMRSQALGVGSLQPHFGIQRWNSACGFVHSTFYCFPDSDFILFSELGSPLQQSPAENSLHSPDLPLKLWPVMNHCAQALLHCVQWCITVLVSPHSHQHLLLSVFFIMPTLESVK